ncbi:uncharacterized protein [Aquarana catesbeiana]|uniref:uncharacterized protein isoform X3 n=1 Tax=Aquarana catesbeiana TaxID=8400 RepID=UPI003CC9BCDE
MHCMNLSMAAAATPYSGARPLFGRRDPELQQRGVFLKHRIRAIGIKKGDLTGHSAVLEKRMTIRFPNTKLPLHQSGARVCYLSPDWLKCQEERRGREMWTAGDAWRTPLIAVTRCPTKKGRTTAAIFTSGTCDRKFSGYIHDPGVTTLEIPVIKKKSFKPTKSSNRGSLQRYQSLYECYVGAVRHIAGGHRRTKPYLFITGIGC